MKISGHLRRFAPLLLAALIVLAPALAQARVGQGASIGSRGTHTYSTVPGAGLLGRSMTPGSAGYGGFRSSRGFGMGGRSGFTSGLLGGLIGAGIGGMLFGRGFFGGMHGGSGLLGLLLQLFLLYMLGSWLYRRFLTGGMAPAGGAGIMGRMGGMAQPGAPAYSGGGGMNRPLSLAAQDYQSFDRLLHTIQAAWSAHDLNALQTMATAEMVSYFAEQMAEQTSNGVRNQVTNVQLQQGNLAEAWSEGTREYATVSMRFSMIDVTRDRTGHVVDGSPTERVTVTEFWTFVRAPGGTWLLSAIQQPG